MQNNGNTKSETKKVVSNSVKLDSTNPIPFEPTGASAAFLLNSRSTNYLRFLDPKDTFFQLLLEAKLLSPTNNSCVNSKTHYCVGDFSFGEDDDENQIKIIKDWSKRVNNKGQSFRKVLRSIFGNHFTVGNNFVEVIRGSAGSKKFIKIINRSFLDCRLSEPNDDDVCEYVFISKQFRKKSAWAFDEKKVVKLPVYYGQDKFQWYKDPKQKTEHCIIHIKNEVAGYDYYGMPENVSSLPQQILEYKGARYNLDNFDNNLVVGGAIFINGNLTNGEAAKIGKDVIYSHTGDGKRGRWAVISGQGIDAAKSGIQQFDIKQDGSFQELDKSVESKIIDSNNWDSALYGQHESAGLGNGGFAYINAIYEIKKSTVIKPTQQLIIEDFISPLFQILDEHCSTKLSELEISFKDVSPATVVGDIAVNKILTKNEGRKMVGYNPMEDDAIGNSLIEDSKQINLKADV